MAKRDPHLTRARTRYMDYKTALLDNGASSHYLMLDDAYLSTNGRIRADPGTVVSGANNTETMLECLGRINASVTISSKHGSAKLELRNAALMPKALRKRLISVGQLTKDGYEFVLKGDHMVIKKGNRQLLKVDRVGNLYPIVIGKLDSDKEFMAMLVARPGEFKVNFCKSMSKDVGTKNAPSTNLNQSSIKSTVLNGAAGCKSISRGIHQVGTAALSGTPGHQAILKDIRTPSRQSEVAMMAKSYPRPKGNLKRQMHILMNHASVNKGTPLDKFFRNHFGDRWLLSQDFECDACLSAKLHSHPHRRKTALEKRQRDLSGPHGHFYLDIFSWPYKSRFGDRYAGVLYDSRMIIPIPGRTKDEIAARVVQELKKLNKAYKEGVKSINTLSHMTVVKTAPDGSIDANQLELTTDGAKEFIHGGIPAYCNEHGIMRTVSCPYKHQQNAAENIVKIVVQGTHANQVQFGGPRIFWVDAMRAFCAVRMRMPNGTNNGGFQTPVEAFFQTDVAWNLLLKHVHPYGCKCWVYVVREKRLHTHAEDTGLAAYFIGYSHTNLGYVVLLRDTNKVLDGVYDIFFYDFSFPLSERKMEAKMLAHERKMQNDELKAWIDERDADEPVWPEGTGDDYSPYGTAYDEEEVVDWNYCEQYDFKPLELENYLPVDVVEEPVAEQGEMMRATQADTQPTNSPRQPTAPTPPQSQVSTSPMPRTRDTSLAAESVAPPNPTQDTTEPLDSGVESYGNESGLPTINETHEPLSMQNQQRIGEALEPPSIGQRTRHPSVYGPVRRSSRSRAPSSACLNAVATAASPTPAARKRNRGEAYYANTNDAMLSADRKALGILTERAMHVLDEEMKLKKAPINRTEMLKRDDSAEFIAAEKKHLDKVRRLKLFKLTKIPPGANVMQGKWVYAFKERQHSDGDVEKSARLTAMGFTQKQYIDYGETYAPTMAMAAYKMNEARAANDTSIIRECWDVEGAFYMASPKYDQYMEPPAGARIDEHGKPIDTSKFTGRVGWKLLKSMPGTKDGSHNWYNEISSYLTGECKMRANPADLSSFYAELKGDWICVNIHVDDAAVFSSSIKLVDMLFAKLSLKYKLKRAKELTLVMGIYSSRDETGIEFHQRTLIDETVLCAGMENKKKVNTPVHGLWKPFTREDICIDPEERKALDKYPYSRILGKVAYIARGTRYDILWIVTELQRYQTNFGYKMIATLLHVVRYLDSTRMRTLKYRSGFFSKYNLIVSVDASYGSSMINRSSHAGYVIYFMGCAIVVMSSRQKVIALSSMESEFMAATEAAKVIVWLLKLAKNFNIEIRRPVPMLEDNQAAIYLSEKPDLNGGRARHMDVRWHWLQAKVKDEVIQLIHIPTAHQVADVLTKAVAKNIFDRLSPALMGEVDVPTPPMYAALKKLLVEGLNKNRRKTTRIPEDSEAANVAAEDKSSSQQRRRGGMQHGPRYSSNNAGDGPPKRHHDELKQQHSNRRIRIRRRPSQPMDSRALDRSPLRLVPVPEHMFSLYGDCPGLRINGNIASVPVQMLAAPPDISVPPEVPASIMAASREAPIPPPNSPEMEELSDELNQAAIIGGSDRSSEWSDCEWEEEVKEVEAMREEESDEEFDVEEFVSPPPSRRRVESEQKQEPPRNRPSGRMRRNFDADHQEVVEREPWEADLRASNNWPGPMANSWAPELMIGSLLDGDRIIDQVHKNYEVIGDGFMEMRRANDHTMKQIRDLLPPCFYEIVHEALSTQRSRLVEIQGQVEESLKTSSSLVHTMIRHAKMPKTADCRRMAEALGKSMARRSGRSHGKFLKSFARINDLRVHPSIGCAVQPPKLRSTPFNTWTLDNTNAALRHAEAAIIGLNAYRVHHLRCEKLVHESNNDVKLFHSRVYVLSIEAAMSRGITPMHTHNDRGISIASCCGDLWGTIL